MNMKKDQLNSAIDYLDMPKCDREMYDKRYQYYLDEGFSMWFAQIKAEIDISDIYQQKINQEVGL